MPILSLTLCTRDSARWSGWKRGQARIGSDPFRRQRSGTARQKIRGSHFLDPCPCRSLSDDFPQHLARRSAAPDAAGFVDRSKERALRDTARLLSCVDRLLHPRRSGNGMDVSLHAGVYRALLDDFAGLQTNLANIRTPRTLTHRDLSILTVSSTKAPASSADRHCERLTACVSQTAAGSARRSRAERFKNDDCTRGQSHRSDDVHSDSFGSHPTMHFAAQRILRCRPVCASFLLPCWNRSVALPIFRFLLLRHPSSGIQREPSAPTVTNPHPGIGRLLLPGRQGASYQPGVAPRGCRRFADRQYAVTVDQAGVGHFSRRAFKVTADNPSSS
jgi:hypothetical protein